MTPPGSAHTVPSDTTDVDDEVADVDPTLFLFVTLTFKVDPTRFSGTQSDEDVPPDTSVSTPPEVDIHWYEVSRISAPPVFQVPSSMVRVVPAAGEPNTVGTPEFTGEVAEARIEKVLVTDEAATYSVPEIVPPAASAVIVQTPVATFVTVVPETVHLEVVAEEKVTDCPEDELALSSKVEPVPI